MAALIKQDTGLEAALEVGGRGELSVWVNGRLVARKDHKGFPAEAAMLASIREALTGV